MDERITSIDERVTAMDQRIASIDQRVTKIEITQEQVINKNIQLLIESQQGMSEKFKMLDNLAATVADIQITVNAMEAVTRQNCADIKQLRIAK
ncbi:MAG: hypothetical protein HFJ80_03785 [Clostridiales bacterium]|nr:hypothetical protein [Clostridiales bacterium]